LIEEAPSPSAGARLTHARIGAVLKQHRIRRLTAGEVRTVLRGDVLSLRSICIESHVARVLVVIARLKLAHAQIVTIEKQIQTARAERVKSDERTERRDLTILLSLPGAGPLTVATALGEKGEALVRRDYNAVRSASGAAPITKQSGGTRHMIMRQVCQPRFRVALRGGLVQRRPLFSDREA
jgi:transposase